MVTVGFDVVTEVNERIMNRALAAAFYTTTIPDAIRGNQNGVDYTIKLNEPPTVDAFIGNNVRILVYAEITVKVYGFTFDLNVKAYFNASPTFDIASRILKLDLKEMSVEDITVGDKEGWLNIFSWKIKLPAFILNWFNTILAAVINSSLLDEVETIDVAPILYSLALPYMPPGPSNELTVGLGNVKILNDKVMGVCVNFLDYTGGNINQLTDFSVGKDICVGVSESSMHRVFDFWWDRTTISKSVTAESELTIPVLTDFLNAVANVFDLNATLATGGILEQDITHNRSWVEYGATVKFHKPTFNLKSGEKLEVTHCELDVHVWATPKLKVTVSYEVDTSGPIPDSMTWWDDDKTISSNTSTITVAKFAIDLHVTIDNAEASIYLDDQNQIMAKIESVDVDIDLGWSLPQSIIDMILVWIEGKIVEEIPPIALSPTVITSEVPNTNLSLQVDIDHLMSTTNEAVVGANLWFIGMLYWIKPVPKFIVGPKPVLLEAPPEPAPVEAQPVSTTPGGMVQIFQGLVHRSDCLRVDDIIEKHKIGFYVLSDALSLGHTPCDECLPEFQEI